MNLENLGARAVRCRHWRWMPGMYLLPHAEDCAGECCKDRNEPRRAGLIPVVAPSVYSLPDFSSPSTIGCMIALVRKAWANDWVGTWYGTDNKEWLVDLRPAYWRVAAPTEAEALVKSLEYAHQYSKVEP